MHVVEKKSQGGSFYYIYIIIITKYLNIAIAFPSNTSMRTRYW